jgi:hypothetical protein
MYGLPANGQRTKTNAKTCKKFNKMKKVFDALIQVKKLKKPNKISKTNLKKTTKNTLKKKVKKK